MDKKAIAYAAIICGMGWLAYPIIYKLIKKRKERKNGCEDEAREMGSASIEKSNAGSRGGKGDRSKLLLGNTDEKEELLE